MTISKIAVVESLKEIVAEYGADYVYRKPQPTDTCQYTNPDGSPSCLVGHVIARVNPEAFATIAATEYYEETYDEGPYGAIEAAVEGIEINFNVELGFDQETIALLGVVQNAQDRGTAWGDALRLAGIE